MGFIKRKLLDNLRNPIFITSWQETVRIDVSGWNAGIYVAVLSDMKGVIGREKFVVVQ